MRPRLHFLPLAFLSLATAGCNPIFGIEPGTLGDGGGDGGDGCDAGAGTCTVASTSGRLGVGHGRACVIEDDSSVKCWGTNAGNSNSDLVPTDPNGQVRTAETVSGVEALQISVAGDHQCALQAGGTVVCWGDNNVGQLGSGATGTSPAGVPGLEGVAEVRTSDGCTCVRLAGGSIECFGAQDYGCLGTASTVMGPQPTPTPIGVTGAVALRMGNDTPSCALLASGGVTCWDQDVVPTPVPGVTGAVDIAVGWDHVFIRDATGVSWSVENTAKNGWTEPSAYPMSEPVAAMSAGDDFCSLTAGGAVSCAQLYYTSAPAVVAPLMQPAGTVVEIASGSSTGYYTGLDCLRLAGPIASSVYCWGDDGGGALGSGEPDDVLTPTAVSLTGPATFLSASVASTSAVLDGGTAVFWGASGGLFSGNPAPDTPAALDLGNDNLAIHDNDTDGNGEAYVVKTSGTVVLLASGMPESQNGGLAASGLSDFIDARPFNDWHIGLRTGGGVVVWAVGADANVSGILGNGMGPAAPMTATTVPNLPPVQAIAAYGQQYGSPQQAHVCVILQTSGQVWCWGSSGSGEVGPGVATGMVAYTPVQVPLPGNDPATTIAAGPSFTCASTASQKVYCWGDNGYGQIGQAPPGGSFPTPTQVPGITNAKGVTALDAHACASLADGTAMCWGQNDFGQLGAGDVALHAGPVAVKGLTNAMQVTAGSVHTCALLTGGGVTCWGSSYVGEVGTGKYGIYPTPQQVLGL